MLPEIIAKLLAFDGSEGDDTNETYEEIDSILFSGKFGRKDYVVKEVHSEIEDNGRWSNITTTVFEVTQSGVTKHFELWRDVPATELQDGQEQAWGFYEVIPKEVTVIKYVPKEDE